MISGGSMAYKIIDIQGIGEAYAPKLIAIGITSLLESAKQESKQQKEEVQQSVSHSDDSFGISLGLLNGSSSYDATAAEEAEFNRLMKKKKAKRKRGFHL